MPSNIIYINAVPKYNVPDRKMEELIEFLEKNSYPIEDEIKDKLRDKCILLNAYSD